MHSPCLMFRKFTLEDISTQNQVKSSIQRGIRGAVQAIRLLRTATFAACLRLHSLATRVMSMLCAAKICTSYPILEESGAIEQILPKKEQALLAKL